MCKNVGAEILWIILFLLVGLCLRSIISVKSYSGYKKPPLFGDFEAQRHWMEITVNLPVNEWYRQTDKNDLMYWGLDYPPLTAYHSLIMGKISQVFNSSWTELRKSQGIENPSHKFFMRCTVLISDCVFFLPGILMFYIVFFKHFKPKGISLSTSCLMSMISPSFILIDHGHFQYNCVSLGLFVNSLIMFMLNHDIFGTILFVSSIMYKQMELYHALPFFFYLLGSCLKKDINQMLFKFFKLSLTVFVSFFIILLPFLSSVEALQHVFKRVFPFDRGIFEDKVSNFWCVSNVFYKWRLHFNQDQLVLFSVCITLLSILPVVFYLLIKPSKRLLLYSQCLCSLSFFLFSYQVHEKTILIPLISLTCIAPFLPHLFVSFSLSSCLSMWPLLKKDGLEAECIALVLIFFTYYSIVKDSHYMYNPKNTEYILNILSIIGYFMIIIAEYSVEPPVRYPDLYPLLISIYSFGHFCSYWCILFKKFMMLI